MMRRLSEIRWKKAEGGMMIAYLLASIALLVLVAMALSRQSNNQVQLQTAFENKQALIKQYQIIRSRILSCGIAYPAGDNGTGFVNRVRYPATPATGKVRDLVCPGLPAGSDNIWTSMGSMTIPLPPPTFSEWGYVSDATSMRLTIAPAVSGDVSSLNVLGSIDQRLGDMAAMVGGTLEITIMN